MSVNKLQQIRFVNVAYNVSHWFFIQRLRSVAALICYIFIGCIFFCVSIYFRSGLIDGLLTGFKVCSFVAVICCRVLT